ncbi:hypothetical protein [Acidithiobacillus sp.]|uniref:sulfotransferase family protein n=1 Tax=Acidithiobacillus sp. TaxID=1872118 RepID=UPI00260B47C7|nr:hypothetical protein [Acidithiobacillus sp.]MDD5280396.1 hypothetical protein [Acidithiobacillus sp.]
MMASPCWIPVLGMHRSGTSAMTCGLRALGAHLGQNLMAPVPDVNPKGFWEDMDIYHLNEEMLQALGTRWYQSTPLSKGQVDWLLANGYLEKAVTLLQGKRLDSQPFAFKDPRLCRLLAFWQEVLKIAGGSVAYFLALRNPVSIADSLQKRDGMDRTQSYLLWLTHTVNSILLTNGQRRVLVNYDALIKSPEEQLYRIADRLELVVEEDRLAKYVGNFLDKNLRHTRHTQVDLAEDPDCPAFIVGLYRDLLAVAQDRKDLDTPAIQKRLKQAWKSVHAMLPLMQAMDRMIDAKIRGTN